MEQIKVVYWSQSGNTKAMAEAIAEGISETGKKADVVEVSAIGVLDLKEEQVLALGCPAMGAEVLEETEMEPFVDEFCRIAANKKVALFGSYGWGDGEWMRDWVTRMQNAGCEVIGGEGLICMDAPDDDTIAKCKELGKELAS